MCWDEGSGFRVQGGVFRSIVLHRSTLGLLQMISAAVLYSGHMMISAYNSCQKSHMTLVYQKILSPKPEHASGHAGFLASTFSTTIYAQFPFHIPFNLGFRVQGLGF